MVGLIVQVMASVLLTNGFRWLGRRVGPRRGALLMGLPTTTAVVLYGYGVERGATEALGAAESGLVGLVAAAVMPVWYANATRKGGGVPVAPLFAILGYGVVAVAISWLSAGGSGPAVVLCYTGVGLAVLLAAYGDDPEGLVDAESSLPVPQGAWMRLGLVARRAMVPAVMGLGARLAREAGGPAAAGLLLSFPATSLALLVTTHLESGPGAARRLARALPPGAFGTASFLSTYLWLVGSLGPLTATVVGFVASLGALGVVEWASTGGRLARPIRRATSLGRLARKRFGRFRPNLAVGGPAEL